MPRNPNTTVRGVRFEKDIVDAVWEKARIINGYDENAWRYDMYGQAIKYKDYGHTGSRHGWEIDHVKPVSKGGTDDLNNLQPLQWEKNREKGNTFPYTPW